MITQTETYSRTVANRMCPLLRRILGDVRLCLDEVSRLEERCAQLRGRPGRPDQKSLREDKDLEDEIARQGTKLDELDRELAKLHVERADDNGTPALLIPTTAMGGQAAWFILDGTSDVIAFWCLHDGGLKRPIREYRS